MTATRGVRKSSENILVNGRAIIVTEKDKNKYKWGDIPDGSKFIDTKTGIEMVKLEGESDWVPANVKNDGTICISKDSIVHYEVFTITEIDFPNKTFRYKNENGDYRNSIILYDVNTKLKEYVFNVEKGDYMPGRNLLKALFNDTLVRSRASGGLREINNRVFSIYDELKVGDEITAIYVHKINIGNPYPRVFIGAKPPVDAEDFDFWLDTNPAPYASRIVPAI